MAVAPSGIVKAMGGKFLIRSRDGRYFRVDDTFIRDRKKAHRFATREEAEKIIDGFCYPTLFSAIPSSVVTDDRTEEERNRDNKSQREYDDIIMREIEEWWENSKEKEEHEERMMDEAELELRANAEHVAPGDLSPEWKKKV